jgi:cytochrome c-type biogenesis protein CcmF
MGVRFDGVQEKLGPNYTAARGTLLLTRGDRTLAILHPERRIYTVSRMPMTETAIDRGFTRDLYVSLGEPLSATAWSVRVYYKPLVGWIWGGCALMALGGLLAVLDRRYRAQRRAPAPAETARPDAPQPALAKTLGRGMNTKQSGP